MHVKSCASFSAPNFDFSETTTRQKSNTFESIFCEFYRYDFDRDGYIIQEDVRLILSHVPIENTVGGHVAKEGVFTQTGGGR